jgi:hypothetical protein
MRALPLIAVLLFVFGAVALAQAPPRRTLPAPEFRPLPAQCQSVGDCDGDGDPSSTDCADHDRTRFHGNVSEVSRIDSIDNDCDPSTLGPDRDRDGYEASGACNPQPDGSVRCAADCDDQRPTINNAAIEACDMVDNDCDGTIDERLQSAFFNDADGDGFGAGAVVHACVAPNNASLRGSDCDDANTLTHPGQFELRDGIDNNCNGAVDEAPSVQP